MLDESVSSPGATIRQMSRRHHALARELASGTPPGQAGVIHGYCASRVSILRADPSFRELERFYESQVNVAFAGTAERLAEITDDALDLIRNRMEEDPDDISIKDAIEIAKLGADRSGHGPQSNQTHDIRIGLGGKLAAALERKQTMTPPSLDDVSEAEIIE